MNVLAIDTCFGAVSVALRWQSARGEWLLREEYEERDSGQAERLMPMIAETMAGAGVAFSAVDRIAVTEGPGSFTGVRVGIAAARALALACGATLVALPSLAVIAARASLLLGRSLQGRPLLVAMDARRGALYAALYGLDPLDVLADPALIDINDALALARTHGALVVGTGGPLIAAAVPAGATIETALPHVQPHARFLAQLAPLLDPRDALKPLYLRAPDAKPPAPPTVTRAP